MAKTHEAFFLTIREKNPDLPIIMASETDTPKTPQKAEDILRRREVILRTYADAESAAVYMEVAEDKAK